MAMAPFKSTACSLHYPCQLSDIGSTLTAISVFIHLFGALTPLPALRRRAAARFLTPSHIA